MNILGEMECHFATPFGPIDITLPAALIHHNGNAAPETRAVCTIETWMPIESMPVDFRAAIEEMVRRIVCSWLGTLSNSASRLEVFFVGENPTTPRAYAPKAE